MQLTSFDRFVWAASFAGNLLLLLVLWRRGRAQSFPVFTAFIASSLARTIIIFWVLRDLPRDYRFIFWSLSALDEALQLLVVYELAVHVFRPTGVWARDVRRTFAGVAWGGILLAAALACLDVPATTDPVQAYFLRGNFFSAALMSELFVGMVALSVTAGLPWKTHVARIAQGLGVYSIFCVARDSASSALGLEHAPHTFIVLSHLRILVYLACEGYWIAMLWQEAPAPRELPESVLTQVYALQRQVEYDLTRLRSWRRP
ncbi:MAG: hypothetical protein ABR910_13095 [Acidobacteriaceae bacterium]|jgi:hypothetical protein